MGQNDTRNDPNRLGHHAKSIPLSTYLGTALGAELGTTFGASPGAPQKRPGVTTANAKKDKKHETEIEKQIVAKGSQELLQ